MPNQHRRSQKSAKVGPWGSTVATFSHERGAIDVHRGACGAISLFRVGALKAPFRFQLMLGDFSLLFIAHISDKELPGKVRLGHESGLVDPTSEKFTITSELEFFTE